MSSGDTTEDPRRGGALALGAASFAAVFLLAFQAASRAAPREAVVLAMLGSAALFNGGLALSMPRAKNETSRRTTWITVGAFTVLTIGGNIGVAGALSHLGPGLTGTILQTQIFLVALGGWLFLKEKISLWFLLGAGLAFGGFVVLGLRGWGEEPIDATGVAFAMLASTSFGAMLLVTRSVITRIEPVSVNVARLSASALVLALLPGHFGAVLELPGEVWLMVVLAAACGPFASRLCLMFASKHIGASRLKMITLVSPVMAFGLEWLVLGSAPSGRELVGGGLILCGVVLPVLSSVRSRRARS